MKLKYEVPKGQRYKKQFTGITTYEDGLWYNVDLKRWEVGIHGEYHYSTNQDCRSIRAFRRKLKDLPKGVNFELTSRYMGCNVYGINKNN